MKNRYPPGMGELWEPGKPKKTQISAGMWVLRFLLATALVAGACVAFVGWAHHRQAKWDEEVHGVVDREGVTQEEAERIVKERRESR